MNCDELHAVILNEIENHLYVGATTIHRAESMTYCNVVIVPRDNVMIRGRIRTQLDASANFSIMCGTKCISIPLYDPNSFDSILVAVEGCARELIINHLQYCRKLLIQEGLIQEGFVDEIPFTAASLNGWRDDGSDYFASDNIAKRYDFAKVLLSISHSPWDVDLQRLNQVFNEWIRK